ncbi:MAG: NAD+ synthase [Acidobacteria bacterium]|nr:NAD+ synthase [Acidobacteriota bacterium]
MNTRIRLALCQINQSVGDLAGNADRLRAGVETARDRGADLVVFPELSITGYPPEDLLLKPSFVRDAGRALDRVAAAVTGIIAVVGAPVGKAPAPAADAPTPLALHNGAAVLADGGTAATYRKHHLPNYAVFDERRYFAPGGQALVIDLEDVRLGISVCEDIWAPGGPAERAALDGGAEVLVNLSASPYHRAKGEERERLFATRCVDHRCFLAFCNAVGGQDELVFDGHSLVIGPDGEVQARGAQFEEDLLVVDLDVGRARALRAGDARGRQASSGRAGGAADGGAESPASASPVTVVHLERTDTGATPPPAPPRATALRATAPLSAEAEVYRALTLGTADYVRKNGFPGAVLGLSGGIDSALALTVAADAIGPDAVTAVSMPSRYTADMNREDAALLADRLGVRLLELPIEDLAAAYGDALAEPFAGTALGVAEENLQARIRGNLLMALSNKFGWLVLTTGNKSEMSVGYATLYGDMAGGFAVLKDVLKTWVYRLAVWRNRDGEVIPQRIIDKPPTAELRADQLDSDSLPPYDVLDRILEAYVERDLGGAEIEALGFDRATVDRVVRLVDRAEYKRRQAPPGVRISTRAFGKDRRLPITNRYEPS